MNSPSETSYESRLTKRGGGIFDVNGAGSNTPVQRDTGVREFRRRRSDEQLAGSTGDGGGSLSPPSPGGRKMSSLDTETWVGGGGGANGRDGGPSSLSLPSSTETAIQQFPLNDIDYESSPAAVAQELSNLQAIRRMSMNVDAADPDLPSFGSVIPTAAPKRGSQDEDDTARLFWVPARLHPELAPKEFKTFIEEKVDKIRRRSGDSDSLSPDGLDRAGSGSSSLRRKKSMLSHQIDTKGNYEDGAERLERKRSKGMRVEGQTSVTNLAELESLVNDPAQLMRRLSLDTARRSIDSGTEVPPTEDMPILPPGGQTLKRSTRTTYRRGSLKKGERVPFSKRAQQRHVESETEESSAQSSASNADEPPIPGLTRVQTEPTPPPVSDDPNNDYPYTQRTSSRQRTGYGANQSSDDLAQQPTQQLQQQQHQHQHQHPQSEGRSSSTPIEQPPNERHRRPPQPRQFHSRLASGGRTTAQLPGYNNTNPLPNIIETLPDGTKVPVGPLAQQQFPERKSSHELPRPMQRGGAHMRPAPGRQQAAPAQTLDDISSNPSPLPGSGSTRTDALTMVPTFEDRKVDRKDSTKKSSWKWILGSDDDDKDKKAAKEEKALDSGLSKSKSKLSKTSTDKTRLDVLQTSIDGTALPRGRESLVLNRADLQLEEERKKESKRSVDSKKDKEKDSGLLSALFGGKKKSSEGDLKEKKRKADRHLSPEPPPRILKPDIDYNWTRFSILEERAIYRMAHIKLANPRRALYSQVLLSNFMYSYLAKVQNLMHPQMQISAAAQQQKQREQQQQQQQQPAEYSQYQRWQQVSKLSSVRTRKDVANSRSSTKNMRMHSRVTTAPASPVSTAGKNNYLHSEPVGINHSRQATKPTQATMTDIRRSTRAVRTIIAIPPRPHPFGPMAMVVERAAHRRWRRRRRRRRVTVWRARMIIWDTPKTSSRLGKPGCGMTKRRRRICGDIFYPEKGGRRKRLGRLNRTSSFCYSFDGEVRGPTLLGCM